MADLSSLRTSYQNVLAEQLKKGLGQVGQVYASRGTTGGGEEAYAVGQLGQQYGQGVAQNELALQQFGEQQRQFDVGQGNWGQQFGLQKELGLGGLDLQKQQLAQSGNQFGQSLAEQVAQRQQQGSQFGQNLAQQAQQFGQNLGLQQAGLTGQYNGQSTVPYLQQQFQNQLAQAGLTGNLNGQQTLAGLQNQQQFGLAQGQLTGQYNGNATQSMINQMMPYITGGYMSNPYQSMLGNIQTEQQIDPMNKYAAQLGLDPAQMAMIANLDPGVLKNIMQGNLYGPGSSERAYTGK